MDRPVLVEQHLPGSTSLWLRECQSVFSKKQSKRQTFLKELITCSRGLFGVRLPQDQCSCRIKILLVLSALPWELSQVWVPKRWEGREAGFFFLSFLVCPRPSKPLGQGAADKQPLKGTAIVSFLSLYHLAPQSSPVSYLRPYKKWFSISVIFWIIIILSLQNWPRSCRFFILFLFFPMQ